VSRKRRIYKVGAPRPQINAKSRIGTQIRPVEKGYHPKREHTL